jgi:phage gpG-like protein
MLPSSSGIKNDLSEEGITSPSPARSDNWSVVKSNYFYRSDFHNLGQTKGNEQGRPWSQIPFLQVKDDEA